MCVYDSREANFQDRLGDMHTHVLMFGNEDVEFSMPETPLEAAELIAYILDEYTGNSLNYPHIMTKADYEKEFLGEDADEGSEAQEWDK